MTSPQDDTITHTIDGVAYVLPRTEPNILFVRRVGPFGVGMNVRWSSWGIGIDILRAGILIVVGPIFFWSAHIERSEPAHD